MGARYHRPLHFFLHLLTLYLPLPFFLFFSVGGPISQLEAQTMTTLRAEIIADLLSKGVSTAPQVATQLVSFERFKQAFGGDGSVSGSGPPSAAERLGQPSAEDRKKEAVAEEEVRIHRQTLAAATKAGWRLQLRERPGDGAVASGAALCMLPPALRVD